jgi:hypothetical protein
VDDADELTVEPRTERVHPLAGAELAPRAVHQLRRERPAVERVVAGEQVFPGGTVFRGEAPDFDHAVRLTRRLTGSIDTPDTTGQ